MPQYDKLVAYHNGQIIPLREVKLSIFDNAIMLGDMIYEMTRTFAHQPFLLDRHLGRLETSLKMTYMDCGLTIKQIEALTLQVLEANLPALEDDVDVFIRHDISRGPQRFYSKMLPGQMHPTVMIACIPLVEYLGRVADAFDTGLHAVVPCQHAIPSRYLDPKAKTRTRIHYQLANLQAERLDPASWAVLVDEHGFLAEGTSSNFAIIKDEVIYTPMGRNILRGVSRSYIEELAADLGLGYVEANIEPYDVLEADEAFFSASSYCMVPVSRFEFRPVGEGKPGPVVKRLLAEWSRRVGVDIVAQAKTMAREYV
jgi:branched-chain amino acid aminotransferase